MSLPTLLLKTLEAAAHTLGLDLSIAPGSDDDQTITLTRHGRTVALNMNDIGDPARPDPSLDSLNQRFLTSAILTGIRLGLDQLEIIHQQNLQKNTPQRPSGPLRAGGPQPKVVRYHEVASIYGDRLLRLFPSLSLDWCEAITHQKLYRLPWLQPGLEITFTEESGRTLDLLTQKQATQNPDPEKLLRDARAALFYDSYRVRPSQTLTFPSGTIRTIRTTEGLGASRALILPEYDWNASQDHGFLAIPDRDTLLIAHPARPDAPASRTELHQELQNLVHQHLLHTHFPLSNATFDLHIDQTRPHPDAHTPSLPLAHYPRPSPNLS